MKKQYTKKQITEAIAYWKKQLSKLNESSQATDLQLDKVLSSTELFDACAMWPNAATQFRMPPAAVDAKAFSQKRGLVKAIGVCIVLSKEKYEDEDELEIHHNKPYEDYIEDEELTLIEAFSNSELMKAFTPARTILVDGIELDFKKCSALVVPYTI